MRFKNMSLLTKTKGRLQPKPSMTLEKKFGSQRKFQCCLLMAAMVGNKLFCNSGKW